MAAYQVDDELPITRGTPTNATLLSQQAFSQQLYEEIRTCRSGGRGS